MRRNKSLKYGLFYILRLPSLDSGFSYQYVIQHSQLKAG